MRTITITQNIYSFEELSDEAKERVYEHFRNEMGIPFWGEEYKDTMETIAQTMGWGASFYSYDGIRYSVEFCIGDEDIEELSGPRAMAYIENNYIDAAKKPKKYWLGGIIHCDGRKNWTRKSRIKYEIDNCPFTGFIADYCFCEAWAEWKKNIGKNLTVQDFADMVADRLGKEWTVDNEYQISDEGIE